MRNQFLVNRREAKVMGVCAGFADYSGLDVTLVRIAAVGLALLTFPVTVGLYVLAGWLAGERA